MRSHSDLWFVTSVITTGGLCFWSRIFVGGFALDSLSLCPRSNRALSQIRR